MFKHRSIRPETLAFLASLLLLSLYNFPLWQHLSSIEPSLTIRASFAIMVLATFTLILALVSFRWVFKPMLIALF